MATNGIDPEVAERMCASELSAVCENYEAIIAQLDADEDAERIGELRSAVHVMESELEQRILRAASARWL